MKPCDTPPTRVTSLSLVRYRRNDYSVPTAYGHRDVVVKGYVDVVVIVCGSEQIARHRRSYGREELIFDPLHYLALWERKTGALDQAAPLTGWALPDEFLRLRRLLQTRLGKAGTREYVQVLRLLEDFRLAHVRGAIEDALRLGAIGFDAVKHLVLCRLDHRPARLDAGRNGCGRPPTAAAADKWLRALVENTSGHASWDNLMQARHTIVHMNSAANMTLRELQTTYEESKDVLATLRTSLGLSTDATATSG